jgi:hypothetical protein
MAKILLIEFKIGYTTQSAFEVTPNLKYIKVFAESKQQAEDNFKKSASKKFVSIERLTPKA